MTFQDKIINTLRILTTPRALLIALILGIVLVIASPILLIGYALWDFDRSADVPSIEKTVVSPDGLLKANFFSISGGGAAGYVSHVVNIQSAREDFDRSAGIVLELSHSRIESLKWTNDHELAIQITIGGRIYTKRDSVEGYPDIKVLVFEN